MIRLGICQVLTWVFMLAVLATSVSADVPNVISYQGRLTDSGGTPLDSVVAMVFTIYRGGEVVWQEEHPGVEVGSGLFDVVLGESFEIPDDCFADDAEMWLGIQIGENAESEPLTRLITVPYAFHSLRADTATYVSGGSIANGWVDEGSVIRLLDDPDTVRIGLVNGGAKVNVSSEGEASPHKAVYASCSSTTSDTIYSLNCLATNYGSGSAVGVYGQTDFEGSGDKIGVRGRGCGAGAGDTYGGHFTTAGGMANTGEKYGVYGLANNLTASSAYGVYGEVYNPNEGIVYGGYFKTTGNGTGARFGVHGQAEANNSTFAVGVSAEGKNYGSGSISGGSFIVRSDGRGDKFGLTARAENNDDSYSYGIATSADNIGNGTIFGLYSSVQSLGSGKVHGGYFNASANSDSNSYGVYSLCEGNTVAGWHFGIYAEAEDRGLSGATAGKFWASSAGSGVHYGVFAHEDIGGSGAAVYASGDFTASGTKSAVMRTSKGTTLMYAVESAEVWFEDFGVGRLVNGRASIELDPLFLETVTVDEEHPMKVFIQLNDDCNGTFVKTSLSGFEVYELRDGISNAAFTYRVVAKRKGYEDERMRAADVGHDDPNLYPERAEEINEKIKAERHNRAIPTFR